MKFQITKLKSSKLFYKKWPFKISCNLRGAFHIFFHKTADILDFCDDKKNKIDHYITTKNLDKKQIKAFALAVEEFKINKNVQIRTEGSKVSIFCMDYQMLNNLHSKLNPWITNIYGPQSEKELEYLLDKGHKIILCDELPKDNFDYRVYFKLKMPADKKQQFLSWANKFQSQVIISKVSTKWMSGEEKYTQAPFMYVKDDKTLSMVGLQLVGYVQRVEKFVVRNSLELS